MSLSDTIATTRRLILERWKPLSWEEEGMVTEGLDGVYWLENNGHFNTD